MDSRMRNNQNIRELVDLHIISSVTGIPLDTLRKKLNGNVLRECNNKAISVTPIQISAKNRNIPTESTHPAALTASVPEKQETSIFLCHSIPALAFSLDKDGYLTDASNLWLETMGYTREQIIGVTMEHFLAEKCRGYTWNNLMQELTRTGTLKDVPLQFITRERTIIDVLFSAAIQQGAGGKPARYISVLTDITRIKISEQKLELLSAAIKQSTDSVMIVDRELKIQFVNEAFVKATGYSRSEVIGISPYFLGTDRPQDIRTFQSIMNTLRQAKSWTGRIGIRRKDGSIFEEESTIYTILDEQGNIRYYTKISRDLSEWLSLENQLHKAQKMEALGRFAGGIAHDFNNVLTGILGYVDLASALVPQESTLSIYFDEISQASRRAVDLVRQLMIFGRGQSITTVQQDVNEIIRNSERLIRRVIGEDIELVTVTEPNLPQISIGGSHLDQIIMNLALNARDAMSRGGRLIIETRLGPLDPALHVSPDPADPENYVVLKVTDTGTGMDEETLQHIFEPFFTTKARDKGNGLGLPSVYGIVKMAGGHILVESSPGKGTTFQIYFPPSRKQSGESSDTVIVQRYAPRQTGASILVVEDEEVIRKMVYQYLTRIGYRVEVAATGADALFAFENLAEKPALAIIDLVLADMGGADVATTLRSRNPETRVLFMSGYSPEEITKRHIDMGENDFIEKPFQLLQLAEKVDSIINSA